LTSKNLPNLLRRIEALEARQRPRAPAMLLHPDPNKAVLRPEYVHPDTTIIILPVGRSAEPYEDGAVDPLIAASKRYFLGD
jgi:hypothetical protein